MPFARTVAGIGLVVAARLVSRTALTQPNRGGRISWASASCARLIEKAQLSPEMGGPCDAADVEKTWTLPIRVSSYIRQLSDGKTRAAWRAEKQKAPLISERGLDKGAATDRVTKALSCQTVTTAR